ncbi:MAG: hypothetical protein N3C13_02430 [Aquificaceae bacterium]|nr:hypothetical protein [Aquificaceae bacterium]MCX8060035.1 hypothetical protein [Aquificaceae bacterium]MDW8096660.1 hypothetical protein [Aquificaceae bacterium]
MATVDLYRALMKRAFTVLMQEKERKKSALSLRLKMQKTLSKTSQQ